MAVGHIFFVLTTSLLPISAKLHRNYHQLSKICISLFWSRLKTLFKSYGSFMHMSVFKPVQVTLRRCSEPMSNFLARSCKGVLPVIAFMDSSNIYAPPPSLKKSGYIALLLSVPLPVHRIQPCLIDN